MKIIISLLILGILTLISCEKDQYAYKKFLEGDEIVYAGLAENLTYSSGRLRVQLQWEKSIDPAVTAYSIYWNNNKDSALVPAASNIGADGIYRYITTGLPEYVQSFTLYSQNDRGHRSVAQTLTGVRVFGPIYNASLSNQRLIDRKYFGTDSVQFTFLPTDTTKVFSRIYYFKNDGSVDSVSFKNNTVTIHAYMPGTKPAIRTFYLPAANAIDTFRVLTADSLPAFYYHPVATTIVVYASSPAQQGSLASLIDNDPNVHYASRYTSPTPEQTYPFTFIFSTGEGNIPVRGMLFYARQSSNRNGDAKDIEIYTSDDNVNYTLQGTTSLPNSTERTEYLFPNGLVTTKYVKVIIRNGYTANAYVVFGEMNLLK